MKDSKYGYIFYIAATICFLFILVYIVTDSPEISPPAEYVYFADESNSQQESSVWKDTSTQDSSETSSSRVTSSKNSKNRANSTKKSLRTSSTKTFSKHYVSSKVDLSSDVVSLDIVSSESVSSTNDTKESSKKEVSSKEEKPPVDNTSIININTATKEQLMTLDGIGEVMSQRIIEFRNKVGGFNSIEEIMSVKGIGEKTFDAIKNRLTV